MACPVSILVAKKQVPGEEGVKEACRLCLVAAGGLLRRKLKFNKQLQPLYIKPLYRPSHF